MNYARSLLHNEQIPTTIKQHTPWRRQVLNDKLRLPTIRKNRSGISWLEGTCWRGREGRLEEEIEKLDTISKLHVCLQMDCTFRGSKQTDMRRWERTQIRRRELHLPCLVTSLCMKRGDLTGPRIKQPTPWCPATWNYIIEVAQTRAYLELSNGFEIKSLTLSLYKQTSLRCRY